VQYLSGCGGDAMVNRVNAAFDDMKGTDNTGGTENSRGLEHMSTVENAGESLMLAVWRFNLPARV